VTLVMLDSAKRPVRYALSFYGVVDLLELEYTQEEEKAA